MKKFKPNDRCEVFGTGTHGDGVKLTIIGKAPNKSFKLPNGQKHAKPNSENSYVVLLDEAKSAPMQLRGTALVTNQFLVTYGVVDGEKMRLIEEGGAP